jgi:hypothetical protein
MFSKFIQFLEDNQNNIILFIGVILISLFSFAIGFMVAKQQERASIRIEQNNFDSIIVWQYNNTNL